MGLINKLKNAFFEEEYVEVDEPEKKHKEKPIAKKVEVPKKEIKKEKKVEENNYFDEVDLLDNEEKTSTNADDNFKFKMLLDEDLIEPEIKVEPVVKPKKEDKVLYPEKFYKKDTKAYTNSYTKDLEAVDYSLLDKKNTAKNFKPSPIISPIYGVLDKNYTKEEIKEKKEKPAFSFVSSKLDVDNVRDKAFGDLSSDIGLKADDYEDSLNASIDSYVEEVETDTMLDMTDADMTPVVDKVTVGDAEEYFQDLGLEYNIDYKDHSHEVVTGKRTARKKKEKQEKKDTEVENTAEEKNETFVNEEGFNNFEEKKEIDVESEEDNDLMKLSKEINDSDDKIDTDVPIEDNLFDLIDSMYDKGE